MKLLQNTLNKPFTITIASTKGGSAKSTNAANIGAFCAEHGLKTLLIDTDTQPTLNTMINGKPDTINFWKCEVIGPRKTSSLTGYLIKNTHLFFGDKVLLNNHCLTLQKEET